MNNAKNEMSATEALYGFCGWLTSQDEKTIMSATDDAAVISDLVQQFCKTNNLTDPRDDWVEKLIIP